MTRPTRCGYTRAALRPAGRAAPGIQEQRHLAVAAGQGARARVLGNDACLAGAVGHDVEGEGLQGVRRLAALTDDVGPPAPGQDIGHCVHQELGDEGVPLRVDPAGIQQRWRVWLEVPRR